MPRRLAAEHLEDRTTPATVTVDTAADTLDPLDGVTSLREAILATNSLPGADTIAFAVPGTGAQTLTLGAALPDVADTVTVDGFTQPGAAPNTSPTLSNATVLIQLVGLPGINLYGGLRVYAPNCVVRGMSITNMAYAVGLIGADATGGVVAGNYLGVRPDGVTAADNDYGVLIVDGAAGNTVGGTAPADRNVIAGNLDSGIRVRSSNANVIAGNLIGLTAAGTTLGNADGGIWLAAGSTGNTIGGATPEARNVISGNGFLQAGQVLCNVSIEASCDDTLLAGNYIGTDAAGTAAAAPVIDDQTHGVRTGAARTTITGNLISGNLAGVLLVGAADTLITGNRIGTDAAGATAVPNITGIIVNGDAGRTVNTVIGGDTPAERNVISSNTMYGIEAYGATADNVVVTGNYLGLNAAGTAAVPTPSPVQAAIRVRVGATRVRIGGTAAGERNVIGGHLTGVSIFVQDDVSVIGNFIGTNAAGTAAAPNGRGVEILDGSGNTIRGNTISGNGEYGVVVTVSVTGVSSSGNVIAGNLIGLTAAGTAPLGNGIAGVRIEGRSSGNTVGGTAAADRNVISGNGALDGSGVGGGVVIVRATGNTVAGNSIGTNPAGTAALGDPGAAFQVGVRLASEAANNVVSDNVISGNADVGVEVTDADTSGNLLAGNLIGLNTAGTAAVPNGVGVRVRNGATGNEVGRAGQLRNVISGNDGEGVVLDGAATTGNVVANNRIGTTAAGTAALGNGGAGVLLRSGAAGNRVGGVPGAANTISGNAGAGVGVTGGAAGNVIANNRIGTTAAGTGPLPNAVGVLVTGGAEGTVVGGEFAGQSAGNLVAFNTGGGVVAGGGGGPAVGTVVSRNAVHGNGGTAIDLNDDGPTPNDPLDADAGPNGLQNFPVLTRVAETSISGTLATVPNGSGYVEFFGGTAPGEARVYLGSVPFTADAAGTATFTFTGYVPDPDNPVVSATATLDSDVAQAPGATSEFSAPARSR